MLINFHLRKIQSSVINGRLYLSSKNIAIVSSMRKRIMILAISASFQLFKRRQSMSYSNNFSLRQSIKYFITLGNVKSKLHLFITILMNRFQIIASKWFGLRWPNKFCRKNITLIVRVITIIFDHIHLWTIGFVSMHFFEVFASAFLSQSPL